MNYPNPGYPPYGQWQQPPRRQKVSAGVLLGVSLWRLVIVACALTGFVAAVAKYAFGSAIPGLSQQASLLTGFVYLGLLCYPIFTGGARHEPRSPWWRGALAVLLLLVGVTYLTLMSGDLDETWALFEHLLTPLAVVIDFIAVGRNQAHVKWWHPLSWIVFPLAYLGYFLAASLGLYGGFFDPDDSGFAGTLVGFIAAVIAVGYVLYGIAKLKSTIAMGNAGAHPLYQQPPYPQQQFQQQYPQQPYPGSQPQYQQPLPQQPLTQQPQYAPQQYQYQYPPAQYPPQ